MPVIQFGVGDILRARILDAGWESFVVKSIEVKPSADKSSVNYVTTFMLIDKNDELNGKEIVRYYNSKAISMMLPLIYAVRGIKKVDAMAQSPEAFAFDVDELVSKKVDANVKQATFEGNLKNELDDFAPYKTMKGAGPAF